MKISGKAAGNRIERTISAVPSLSVRPVLIRIGLMLRTALMVNSATGMMPWMAPNAIFAGMPSPKASSRIG